MPTLAMKCVCVCVCVVISLRIHSFANETTKKIYIK